MTGPQSAHNTGTTPALSPLKRAFLALDEAQARIAALEGAAREPIAVIGVGCRVPGAANTDEFWTLMRDGIDAIGPIPADRWNIDDYYDADPAAPGKIATRSGGFLNHVDRFDAAFFGIAPREAQGMDPQQRLLLEVAWEALEHAGLAPDRLQHTATGVYVGVTTSDYAYLQLRTGDPSLLNTHFAAGIAHSIVSGRLSYLLGLQGPSLTLDTACSSSLVAVHLAAQALRRGECRTALAGGVNLILAPDLYIALSHARMLAPDGRCKTFDASADGFARGEGCGVVVLKRLADAVADGDRVLAVIRGSAVNQDGPSSGLTAPNGPAQEAVIRAALADAGVCPADVGYVEAHGTGTQLGDPLEVEALGAVFAAARADGAPLRIGSVKTNVGHLEAAAGVVGLIKLVLALRHQQIPQHLHFRTPSPHIDWGSLSIDVPTRLSAWEPIDGRRIGGVSSFGFSGTNAHVLLEQAPETAPTTTADGASLLTVSARDAMALRSLAASYDRALQDRPEAARTDICYTSTHGRAHFAHRAAVVGRSLDDIRQGLRALAAGERTPSVHAGYVTRRDPPTVAFLFTGQGAQYAGMAQGLYGRSPVFRDALDRCAAGLAPFLERPLLDVIFGGDDKSLIDETAYTQPSLFAVEYALAQMWRAWGVEPSIVMGHSVGELAAACIAGVLDLDAALRMVALRGRLMQSLPSGGAMAAVSAPPAIVSDALQLGAERVSIAAVNMPGQTVLSGPADDVRAVCQSFEARGITAKPLTVSHAFHSALMDPILDAFEREIASIPFAAPQLRLISNLTGAVADASLLTSPTYWRRHIRETVRFADGLQMLLHLRPDVVIEIGPHATLLPFLSAVTGEHGPLRRASLRKGQDDWAVLLETVADLYVAGVAIDWHAQTRAVRGGTPQVTDLPSYPFQRERFWFQGSGQPARAARSTGHPLLGARIPAATTTRFYSTTTSADEPAYLRHHVVRDHIIVPAAAYLSALLALGQQVFRTSASLRDVEVAEAMVLADDGTPRLMQITAEPGPDRSLAARISSTDADTSEDSTWIHHVTATVHPAQPVPDQTVDLAATIASHGAPLDVAEFYKGLQRRGLGFGSTFHAIRRLHAAPGSAIAEVALDDELAGDRRHGVIHPVLLDGCLQTIAAALPPMVGAEALYVPVATGQVEVTASVVSCWSLASVRPGTSSELLRADVRLMDASGRVIGRLQDVQLARLSANALARLGDRWLDSALYALHWDDVARAEEQPTRSWDPSRIVRAVEPAIGAQADRAGLAAYAPFLAQLEALATDFIIAALHTLGWHPEPGVRVTREALTARLGISPSHARLFDRLLAILGEQGVLARDGDAWTVVARLPQAEPLHRAAQLRAACPAGAEAELALVTRAGSALAPALRGDADAMELLFPGGSLETAEQMYRDSPTARVYNGLIADVIGRAVEATAETVRVLEVGGGTGGTTAYLLPRIAGTRVHYTFTDVGPLFVARAAERFGHFPQVQFDVLDLEKNAEAPQIGGRFDIIIASNVVHATADVRRTLAGLHRLLVPGGLLVMLEVTSPQRWFDVTVGLTPGWWAFTDRDLRPDYATLSSTTWQQVIGESGFDAVATLPDQPIGAAAGEVLARQSIIVARASRHRDAGPWVLLADERGFIDRVAARLRARGERCVVLRDGAQALDGDEGGVPFTSPSHLAETFTAIRQRGALAGVVHGAALDAPAWESTSRDMLDRLTTRGALSALRVAQVMTAAAPTRLWLLTQTGHPQDGAAPQTPTHGTLAGFSQSLRVEHPELQSTVIDVDPADGEAQAEALAAELIAGGRESLVALHGGRRRVARVRPLRSAPPAVSDTPWRLSASTASLDALVRVPGERRTPRAGEVEIAVQATGLNFKDVLNVLGLYPGNPGPLGGECAGTVTAVGPDVTDLQPGDEVMAVGGGAFASHVTTRALLVQRRPEGVTAEEGAAFSIAYLTASYCLEHLAQLRPGQRVLIHAGAGGVGMAAIRIAQQIGAEVFATAGSDWKRDALRSMGVTRVFDSRSAAFAEEVLAGTQGLGVDVVLNSLSGDLIDASFSALAVNGCFLEIGKRGIKEPSWVAQHRPGVRYHVIDWGEVADTDPALIGQLYRSLVARLAAGALAPLPRHVFPLDAAPAAFRLMAQARHLGRIVVRHTPDARWTPRRDGTYLITGGLSGLGLQVARWLAEGGAGRLVLLGRRGVTPESEVVLRELRDSGVTVMADAVDVADEAALVAVLRRIRRSGPPLRGVFHAAGVLANAGLAQQSDETMRTVFAPKVEGGYLLDRLTRGEALDCFVLFSSLASVLGAPGQLNHGAANSFLDLLAHARASRGLPALSINWGPWSDVGAAAERRVTERLEVLGVRSMSPTQGLQALTQALTARSPQVVAAFIEWAVYAGSRANSAAFLDDVMSSTSDAPRHTSPAKAADAPSRLREQLHHATEGRRRTMLASFVQQAALRALGMDPARPIDPRVPLGEIGLDSLLSVELRNTLSAALAESLPATLLFDYPTIDALTAYLAERILGTAEAVITTAPPAMAAVMASEPSALVSSIEDLSDEEVERRLAQRSTNKKSRS